MKYWNSAVLNLYLTYFTKFWSEDTERLYKNDVDGKSLDGADIAYLRSLGFNKSKATCLKRKIEALNQNSPDNQPELLSEDEQD